MKYGMILGAILAGATAVSCSSATMRGHADDMKTHLHDTYIQARLAGFGPERARHIAASNYYADEHPETTSVGMEKRVLYGALTPLSAPTILLSGLTDWTIGRKPFSRAFGSRTAEVTSWAITPMAHKLHFPAPGVHDKVEPAFVKDRQTGQLHYNNPEALALIERAYEALQARDGDTERALGLLGIGLHTMQDSYKHASYCAARGHIGMHPNPDDTSDDLDLTLEISEATFSCLRYAYELLHGKRVSSRKDWETAVRRVYGSPLREGETWDHRWICTIRETFGDAYGPWSETRSVWLRTDGDEAFARALETVREVLQ